MTTTTAATRPTGAPFPGTPTASSYARLAVGVTGGVLVANSVLGATVFLGSEDYSVIAGSVPHLLHYLVWTTCLVALSQIFPMLGGLRGRTGRRISPVVLCLAGAGSALGACAQFVVAFVNEFLADEAPALLDAPPEGVLLVALLAASGAAMVGTTAFGVAGAIRKVVPVPAAALLVLGGLLIPVLGPVSNLFVGLGLVWVGCRAGRRTDSANPA